MSPFSFKNIESCSVMLCCGTGLARESSFHLRISFSRVSRAGISVSSFVNSTERFIGERGNGVEMCSRHDDRLISSSSSKLRSRLYSESSPGVLCFKDLFGSAADCQARSRPRAASSSTVIRFSMVLARFRSICHCFLASELPRVVLL